MDCWRASTGRLAPSRSRPMGSRVAFSLLVLLAACGGIKLPSTEAGSLTIRRIVSPEPIIPSGKPENASMAVYLELVNRGDLPDTLVGVSSAMARSGMLHGSMSGGGMAAMMALVVPPHDTVRLAPGGTHLMFEGLSRVIEAGDNLPIVLRFANQGEVAVLSRVVSYTQFDALRGKADSH